MCDKENIFNGDKTPVIFKVVGAGIGINIHKLFRLKAFEGLANAISCISAEFAGRWSLM